MLLNPISTHVGLLAHDVVNRFMVDQASSTNVVTFVENDAAFVDRI